MSSDLIGMDFGTTNSGMAYYDETTGRLNILPLDPEHGNPRVVRSALYLTNSQEIAIGRRAVDRYMAENTGRPVRLERVWVGEIEVRAEDMYYVTDVYVYTDVMSPGRLFLSLKTGLRDPDYLGTVVGQFYYSLEDLIALYLTATKKRAEKILGRELRRVVLGRPARFAFDPEHDRLAQNRLLDAALRAGYETVYFQPEPLAAATAYAVEAEGAQTVLVFDFGGGTLDVTILRLAGPEREILATGGIPIAGDIFDQKVTRAKLPRHFGEGSLYQAGRQTLPIPSWIYDIFSDWQRILELQSPERREMLAEIARGAHRPREIEALQNLVGDNYGLQMFDAVEQAKRRLSTDLGTLITFSGPKFNVRQLLTRTEFEAIIRQEVQLIDAHLDQLLVQAGLSPAGIDVVVRTGGSAEIPIFREMLEEKFPQAGIRAVDTFSSVTAGLGLIAREVAAGRVDLTPYTRADLQRHSLEKRSNVGAANLQLLQRRIDLQEKRPGEDASPERVVVTLRPGNQVAILHWPQEKEAETAAAAPTQALPCAYDEELLAVTNLYRFLRFTPRQLDELAALDLALQDLFHLRDLEQIETMASWTAAREQPWLLLATSRGFARAFPLPQLRERLESPAPYQFDHPLPGVPILLTGAGEQDELLLANEDGRLLRLPLGERRLRLRGIQAMKLRDDERACSALCLPPGGADELLLLTADGSGRRVARADLPLAVEPNLRPPIFASRKPTRLLFPIDLPEIGSGALFAGTAAGWRPVDLTSLPPAEASTRTYRIVKLPKGEEIGAAFIW